MIFVLFYFCVGLILIIKGGDWFVDSATEIAHISGLPKIFIGATIVSIATTLPEMLVSITAAFQGETTMSIGNGVGSMICNIGLILSISAVFGKIIVTDKHFKIKAMMLVLSLLFLISISLDGKIARNEAFGLIFLLFIYMYINIKLISNDSKIKSNFITAKVEKKLIIQILFFFMLGIIFIIAGSNLIVNNGIILAKYFNIPPAIISLTLIALGTSLPELVTGITSLLKGNEDICLGNIIGANILNSVMVIGSSGLVTDLEIIPQNLMIDMPVALTLYLLLVIPTLITKRVSKLQGIFMFSIYVAYLMYIL